MTMTCGRLKDIDVGQISGSWWKLNGREIKDSARIKKSDSNTASTLTVNNVILADIGESKTESQMYYRKCKLMYISVIIVIRIL